MSRPRAGPCRPGGRRRRPGPWGPGSARLIGLLLAAWAAPLPAQTLGAAFGLSDTRYRELDTPSVVGATFAFPVGAELRLRMDLRWHWQRVEWRRSTCLGLVLPDDPCSGTVDTFEGNHALWSAGLGMLYPLELGGPLSLELAASGRIRTVGGHWRGRETGSRFGITPEGADFGVGFASVLVYRVGDRVALTAELSFEHLDGGVAVVDAYTGFREESHLGALVLGVRVTPLSSGRPPR